MSTPAIEVAALEKHYGAVRAVDGVSFTVHPGEVFGILGPNGAGKTTTVEILEGYRPADAGRVTVLGHDPATEGERLRARIGVMLQEGGLQPGLRPPEVLRLFAAFYDDPDDPDVLLARVGLTEAARTPVRRLSGGQAQRLSLAAALVGCPEVAFLDEPTAGMDPHARAATWDLVREQRSQGVTIVLTTHLMDEAESLCDRVAILAAGRVAALGSPAELTAGRASDDVAFTARAGIDRAGLAGALGVGPEQVVEERPGDYVVRTAATPELLADLAAWMRDHDGGLRTLRTGPRATLEQVFLQLTAEGPS